MSTHDTIQSGAKSRGPSVDADLAQSARLPAQPPSVEGVRYPDRFAQLFDVRPIAVAAAALTQPGTAVSVYPDVWLSYGFYMRRPVSEVDRAALEELLGAPARGAVVTTRRVWAALASRAHPSWRVVASHRAGNRHMVVLGGE